VVNKASKYFHVLIYDMMFSKLYIGFKMYTFWINLKIILIDKTLC